MNLIREAGTGTVSSQAWAIAVTISDHITELQKLKQLLTAIVKNKDNNA